MRRRAAGGLTLILAFSPQGRRDLKETGMRGSRLRGNDGGLEERRGAVGMVCTPC